MAGFKCKFALITCAILTCQLTQPISAQAKPPQAKSIQAKSIQSKSISHQTKTTKIDIQPIEDSSTDIFDVLLHIPKAQRAYEIGDYASALHHYRYVYMHDPAQSQAAIGYADAALALGQSRLAAPIYQTYKMDNTHAQSGWLLTQILLKTVTAPERQLREQLKVTPNDARLWNMLGHILDGKTYHSDARQAYAMAELSGQQAGLSANNIGQSFLQEGNIMAAQGEFTRATRAAPQTLLFDNNRRLSLLLHKEYGPALAHLDKDRAAQLLQDAAIIVSAQGEPKLAAYFLEKSIALNPVYDPKTHQLLARLGQ